MCQPGLEIICDNNDVCDGIEYCNPQTGCETSPGMQCDDGDLCTGAEVCDPMLGCILGTQIVCEGTCAFGEVGTCDPSSGCLCLPPPCDLLDCGQIGSVSGTCDSVTFDCSYDLADASLVGEDLRDNNLSDMDLSGADMRNANLSNTSLQNADLSNADLSGADLSTADLSGTNLTGAQYNSETNFPPGFDPAAAGMLLVSGSVPSVGLLGMSVLVSFLLLATLSIRRFAKPERG